MLAFIPRTIRILSEQYLPTLRSLYTALVCVPTMMIPLKSGARGPISMIKLVEGSNDVRQGFSCPS